MRGLSTKVLLLRNLCRTQWTQDETVVVDVELELVVLY